MSRRLYGKSEDIIIGLAAQSYRNAAPVEHALCWQTLFQRLHKALRDSTSVLAGSELSYTCWWSSGCPPEGAGKGVEPEGDWVGWADWTWEEMGLTAPAHNLTPFLCLIRLHRLVAEFTHCGQLPYLD